MAKAIKYTEKVNFTSCTSEFSVNSLKNHANRLLLDHYLNVCFNTSGKVYLAHELKTSLFNELLDLVFVAVFLTIDKQICSHGGNEVPTSLQTAVDVIHGRRGHVVWHEDTTGAAAVELAFELGGEDLNAIAKEESIAIFVQSFSLGMLNEFLRCISSINVEIPLLTK